MLFLLAARAAGGVVTPRPVVEELGPAEYALGKLEYTCTTKAGAGCLDVLRTMLEFYEPLLYPLGAPKTTPADAEEDENGAKPLKIAKFSLTTTDPPRDFVSANETYELTISSTGIQI